VTQTQPAAVKGKRGIDAVRDPATNKSSAFTEAEREGLGLWTTSGDVTTTERQESSSSAASRSFPSMPATGTMVSTRCPRSTIVASASR